MSDELNRLKEDKEILIRALMLAYEQLMYCKPDQEILDTIAETLQEVKKTSKEIDKVI